MKKTFVALALIIPLAVAVASTTFTQNLSLGSRGPEVIALQQMLVTQGYLVMPLGVSYGYFGTLTKAALIRWQMTNAVSPAAGYWGPISRARYTALTKVIPPAPKPAASVTTPTSPQSTPVVSTPPTPALVQSTPTPSLVLSFSYPLHTNITAAVFWVGEPQGNGSSENNALSAWDDTWQKSYGGYDDYQNRNGYYPVSFTPKENPFYLDLPYNDFTDNGNIKSNRLTVVPWSKEKTWSANESMMKNRWVKLTHGDTTCYGQIEDAGPYQYDDYNYVFSSTDARPKSTIANNAGMDVSPALRDCLHFVGQNNVDNKVNWQFINAVDVPNGPWREIITTSQINWP